MTEPQLDTTETRILPNTRQYPFCLMVPIAFSPSAGFESESQQGMTSSGAAEHYMQAVRDLVNYLCRMPWRDESGGRGLLFTREATPAAYVAELSGLTRENMLSWRLALSRTTITAGARHYNVMVCPDGRLGIAGTDVDLTIIMRSGSRRGLGS